MTGRSLRSIAILVVVPSLIVSATLLLIMWHHHEVLERSPAFATQAQAEGWVASEYRANRCIALAKDVVYYNGHEYGGPDLTGGHPYRADLKCHQRKFWWKVLAIVLGPLLFMLIVIRLLVMTPAPREH